jgi:hypothetical protein
MRTIRRPSRIRITSPDAYLVADRKPTDARSIMLIKSRRRTSSPPSSISATTVEETILVDSFLDGFQHHGMELIDAFSIGRSSFSAIRGAVPAEVSSVEGEMLVDVPIRRNEEAILLTQQNGIYRWLLPLPEADSAGSNGSGIDGQGEEDEAIRRFHIGIHPDEQDGSAQRTRTLQTVAADSLKVFVFKFTVMVGVGHAVTHLEQRVHQGFTLITNEDPDLWHRMENSLYQVLAADRPMCILLLLHSTFSNTLGSYAALGTTPWGRSFIHQGLQSYDAILGFDHPTLSKDPHANAQDLLQGLQAMCGDSPPSIDIIAHGRGGLVARSLTDQLLPASEWQPEVRHVILVGAPNTGTPLADPERWHTLANQYTNVVIAGCRVLSLLPSIDLAATIARESLVGLSILLKSMVSQASVDHNLPGLAALQPDSHYIRQLNKISSVLAGVPVNYCTITTRFAAQLSDGRHDPQELPRQLILSALPGDDGHYMSVNTDLLVETDSMGAVGTELANLFVDRLEFGRTPHIYHTSYFLRPEVTYALHRWLGLTGAARESGPVSGEHLRKSAASRGGRLAGDLPVAVDPNLLTVPAFYTMSDLRFLLQDRKTDYVIVRQRHAERIAYYGFLTAEVDQRLFRQMVRVSRDDLTLADLFELEAGAEWSTCSIEDVWRLNFQIFDASTYRSPCVVLDGDNPVGVFPGTHSVLNSLDLVKKAAAIEDPRATVTRGVEPPATRNRGSDEPRGVSIPPFSAPSLFDPQADSPEIGLPAGVPKGLTQDPYDEVATVETQRFHFYAEMSDQVVVGRTTTLIVTVSPEVIAAAIRGAIATHTADVTLRKKLIIDIIPRQNLAIISEDEELSMARIELDPVTLTQPEQRYIDLRPTHVGKGEIQIIVRQGQVPLATLTLKTKIVDTVAGRTHRVVAETSASRPSRFSSAVNQFRIMETRNGNEIRYQYDLELPTIGVLQHHVSEPILGNRDDYVNELYQRIEECWLVTQADTENFAEEMRSMGGELCDRLFPRELKETLWEHRHAIKSIQVISLEPFIPWEIVHLKEHNRPLPDENWFLGQMGMVRWLHGSYPPEEIRIRPGRSRFLIPNYPLPEDELPETAKEKEFLIQKLGAQEVTPDSASLRDLIRRQGAFDLFHFAGHGSADESDMSEPFLKLQGRLESIQNRGYTQWQSVPDTFRAGLVGQQARLRDGENNMPLVVLNACQVGRLRIKLTSLGGFAQAFLSRGAGAFVSALWSVEDKPSRIFIEAFYNHLLAGKSISQATTAARASSRQAGEASWLAYTVYAHPNARIVWE